MADNNIPLIPLEDVKVQKQDVKLCPVPLKQQTKQSVSQPLLLEQAEEVQKKVTLKEVLEPLTNKTDITIAVDEKEIVVDDEEIGCGGSVTKVDKVQVKVIDNSLTGDDYIQIQSEGSITTVTVTPVVEGRSKFVSVTGDNIIVINSDFDRTPDKPNFTLIGVDHNFASEPQERVWEYNFGGLWIPFSGENNSFIEIPYNAPIFPDGGNSCVIRYRVGDMFDIITVAKLYNGSSVATCIITSTQGDFFLNGDVDTVLSAHFFYGTEELTDRIDIWGFQWTRVTDDPIADQYWNANVGKNTKSVTLTGTMVWRKATFFCDVTTYV